MNTAKYLLNKNATFPKGQLPLITRKLYSLFWAMAIDTIHLEIDRVDIENLVGQKAIIDTESGVIENEFGYSNCIKISHYKDKWTNKDKTRIECSLPKLSKRNNVYCLSSYEIKAAIKKIEVILNLKIPLDDAIVRRIDFFVNIETDYPPSSYFRFLSDSRYFVRSIVGKTTLYYKNKKREICFYDKIKEMLDNQTDIPNEYNDKNLMRIEYRLKNTYIKSLFDDKVLLLKDLLSKEETMIKLMDDFREVYFGIFREKKVTITLKKGRLVKDFDNLLRSEGIKAKGGINSVLEIIDDLNVRENLSPESLYKLKKKAKSISKMNGLSSDDKRIIELDEKFMSGYEDFKATLE